MKNLPVAVYVRISKDSESMGLGVKRQHRDCLDLAARRGWNVVEVYEDNDVSATRSKVRPAYQRMVRAIESGEIKGILVWDVDRLTRTPRELEDVIDWADKLRLELASVGGDIDLATPQGRLTARIKGSVARHEAEQQSRRLKAKARELAEKGQYVGPRPFGWDWSVNADGTKGKGLVINEREADLVRDAARRILSGGSIHSVCNMLNDAGVRTARDAKWRSQNVRKLLMRSTNIGRLMHNGHEMPGSWEPILDERTHERLVALLTQPDRVTNRGTSVRHLLSGIIRCGLCGSQMYAAKGGVKRSRAKLADGTVTTYSTVVPDMYRCTPPGYQKVQQAQEPIEYAVTGYIVKLLEREGVEIFGGDENAMHEAQERLSGIQAKLAIMADQFIADEITEVQFKRMNAKLRMSLDEAQAELRQATPDLEKTNFTSGSVLRAWQDASLEVQRGLIKDLMAYGLEVRIGQPGKNPLHPDSTRSRSSYERHGRWKVSPRPTVRYPVKA